MPRPTKPSKRSAPRPVEQEGAALAPAAAPPVPQDLTNDPAAMLQAVQAAGGAPPGGVQPDPKVRPEVPREIIAQVDQWFKDTDNLVQRGNALWEFREANKTLFPARFNPNDARRGQVPHELRNGRDNRRVQTPYLYRDSLQTTAMAVPEDLTFRWNLRPQVSPPQPTLGAMQAGMPPVGDMVNQQAKMFAESLEIVQRALLEEADWIPKVQAMVQDGSIYPTSCIKHIFRRDYSTVPLTSTPQNTDSTDMMAQLTALMKQYAGKEFDENSPNYARMLDLVRSLGSNASISQFFGLVLTNVPLDAVGISEEAADLVDIYDAPWIFHDVLMTGEQVLSRFPYKVDAQTNKTYGILPHELNEAVPWDSVGSTSTDPNARNRASRNRQLTAPRATSINAVATTSASTTDPKRRKYVVREIWCKRDRTVYTCIRGVKHYLEVAIPQNRSERWYPFTFYTPNRVPTEIYGASDLELKRDIQARIHRKRTDEEKARFNSIERFVYNTSMNDSKEMVKLSDIPPMQMKGINFGSGQKPSDAIFPIKATFDVNNYDTTKDERDKDMMGALPSQALGTTGQANFATEVSTAAQGAAIAVQFRQNIIRRCIDGMLTCIGQELAMEMTQEEAQRVGGPFVNWPAILTDAEAAQILKDAQLRAQQQVAPLVMAATVQDMQAGIPLEPSAVQRALESQAAPIWQAEMMAKYGNTEPPSRESLIRRLKIKVKSTLLSAMDRQQRIMALSQLSGAVLQLAQAAQACGQLFNPRPLLRNFSLLADDDDNIDEMFPAVDPLQLAVAQTQQAAAAAGDMKIPGAPTAQGGEGPSAEPKKPPPGPEQQQSPGTPTPDKVVQ